jgi:hypothetical protein
MISWSSWKHGSIAQSTTEVEYIATDNAGRKAVRLKKLVFGLFGEKLETTIIHCDNRSCIKLTKNLVFHDRSKNIDMKYHYIKDMVQMKMIKLKYIAIDELIQVDIGGHPPIPTGSSCLFLFSMFFCTAL